jgi:Fe-S oxidoreductase
VTVTADAHGFFAADKCTLCGECFTRCQYMDLTRGEAILEIKRLIEDRPTKSVLRECVSCYACDAFCPEDAGPYQLILEKWSRRYDRDGLPVRAAYMLPYQVPNYRTDMVSEMSPREKELLTTWKQTPAQGEVLYPGCNLLTLPSLLDLGVLDTLPVWGDWSLCCGEPFYRLGAFAVMEQIAAGLTEYYADKKITKMIFACPACLNMFRNVLPGRFGAKFDFECEYVAAWLLRRLDGGQIQVRRPLQRTVAVHDSCHGRILGDEIMEQTRELYARLGATIVNMKHHHEDGICCGIAAGCNRQMPQDIVRVGWRELREGVDTGAREMAIYCTGCYLILNIIQNLSRRRAPSRNQRLVHTLELLAEAVGEQTSRAVDRRARRMLGNIIRAALSKVLSTKRYKIGEIKIGQDE